MLMENASGEFLAGVACELFSSYHENQEVGRRTKPLPEPDSIIRLFLDIRKVFFPGYFGGDVPNDGDDGACLLEYVGTIYWRMARQIHNAMHGVCDGGCVRQPEGCEVMQKSCLMARQFVEQLPEIRRKLLLDVKAAYRRDPAATSYDDIILSYPGILAVAAHRVAHELYKLDLKSMARILSEYAHSKTGIDIHPGAQIGESFFIDHGTGVVIGETTVIGDNVTIYQGVTLGALRIDRHEDGDVVRGTKRHPTIEDNVTIYAGATVLGGQTVVGRGSEIGGNVWLIESVPPGSKVLNVPQIRRK
ncbi:MAG: serine acetyltransferase [Firmicutes bacterium]|nr:serine acetyltransferase [Bacillota bacterium]